MICRSVIAIMKKKFERLIESKLQLSYIFDSSIVKRCKQRQLPE